MCGDWKPLSEFHRHKERRDGTAPYCKPCDHLRRKQNRQKSQEKLAGRPRPKVCEVCEQPSVDGQILHWDHDHKTGKFRGWLCDNCNRAVGMLQDNPLLALRLADYLERSGPGPTPFYVYEDGHEH